MEGFVEIVKEGVQVRRRKAGRIGTKRFHLAAVLGKFRRLWIDLADHQVSEMFQKVTKNGGRLFSSLQDPVKEGQGGRTVTVEDMMGKIQNGEA